MKILGCIISTILFLLSCSDNNSTDPPIVGKWVLNRYETGVGGNNNPPGQCEYAMVYHIQNTGQISCINTSNQCGAIGITVVGSWRLSNDSIICRDANGAMLTPSGKVITSNSTELTISLWNDKYFYKKQN